MVSRRPPVAAAAPAARLLISLGVASMAVIAAYVTIVALAPTMYVEKAFNILAATFLGSAVVTFLILMTARS
jgi:hypothetical protein